MHVAVPDIQKHVHVGVVGFVCRPNLAFRDRQDEIHPEVLFLPLHHLFRVDKAVRDLVNLACQNLIIRKFSLPM